MKIIRTKGRGAQQTAELLSALEVRGGAALDAVLPAIKRIVSDVRNQGDRALLRYAAQFDGIKDAASLRISPDEMAAAWEAVDPALRMALMTAADQIRAFAVSQLPASWSESPIPGLTTGQLVRPLGSVGCYVPSGRHPLPSTLLMTAIPAQVAALAALDDERHLERTKKNNTRGLRFFEREFKRMAIEYIPSSANFILARVGDGQKVFEALQQKGIITRPMGGYRLPEWLRISVGTPKENKKCVDGLKEMALHHS